MEWQKKNGPGLKYGVVPQVVSTDKDESKGEKKGPNMTINPTSDLYPNYDLNLNCDMKNENSVIIDTRGVVPRQGEVLSSEKKGGIVNR